MSGLLRFARNDGLSDDADVSFADPRVASCEISQALSTTERRQATTNLLDFVLASLDQFDQLVSVLLGSAVRRVADRSVDLRGERSLQG